MTIVLHELRRNRIAWIVWTAIIAGMLAVCILIFPQMKDQMAQMNDMMAQMGSLADAYSMDRLNLGNLLDYFGIECGQMLGLGGALFAAITGIQSLAKEEKEHTAEFLLTHPISRTKVVAQKLIALMMQVIVLNLCVWVATGLTTILIGERMDFGTFAVLMLAYLLLQVEVAAVTFGISAFLKRNGMGIGLGLAIVFYFLDLIANMVDQAKFLKYFTPFSYVNGADIIESGCMTVKYVIPGLVLIALGIFGAFWKYTRKDIS